MSDPRLDAWLRDLPPPPPLPAGLAARVLAAAEAAPQEPREARARRAARRDRRGRWLRRPLLAGTAALGLLVTSAVAATLAGVPIPQKIAAVFFPEKAPEPRQVAEPRRTPRPTSAPARAAGAQVAEAAPPTDTPPWYQDARPWRRLFAAQRMVEARRAMGLPTPGADRLERQLRRRDEMWRRATPEQRTAWLQQREERQAARRAAMATPEGRAAMAARRDRMGGWRARRQAGLPPTPEERAVRQEQIRQWRAQREAGIPLTPEQRAERQEQMLRWRMARQGDPALTQDQRLRRQERMRQWREARRARWEARNRPGDATERPATEGTDDTDR